jgi:hypothetical protein
MAQKLQRKSPTQVDARNHSFISRLDLKGKKNSDDLMVTAIFDDAPLKNETSGEVKISAENCLFHPFYTSKKSSPTIKKTSFGRHHQCVASCGSSVAPAERPRSVDASHGFGDRNVANLSRPNWPKNFHLGARGACGAREAMMNSRL